MLIEEYDSFIIVSFIDATLVLSIGETVEEVTDTGFLNSTPTLTVAQLGEDALVQVGKTESIPASGEIAQSCYRCILAVSVIFVRTDE